MVEQPHVLTYESWRPVAVGKPVDSRRKRVKAKVIMDEGMTFLGSADGGSSVKMVASPYTKEGGEGVSPMQMILIALGGCTFVDVVSILRKKRQEVTGFEIELEARRAEDHPRVFTNITVKHIIRGHNLKPSAIEQAIALSDSKYCSVQAMLGKSAIIEHSYEIVEES
jgi:putative redox protein